MLYDCEEEVWWDKPEEQIYQERKTCLTNKCYEKFSDKGLPLQGCLFLSDWMEAAGEPFLNYLEVPCPDELKSNW